MEISSDTSHIPNATVPFASSPKPCSSQQPSRTHPDHVYAAFASYPFNADPEFQSGLSAIFNHPGTPVSQTEIDQNEETCVQAKCFYFTR